jgi:hypothetical protein
MRNDDKTGWLLAAVVFALALAVIALVITVYDHVKAQTASPDPVEESADSLLEKDDIAPFPLEYYTEELSVQADDSNVWRDHLREIVFFDGIVADAFYERNGSREAPDTAQWLILYKGESVSGLTQDEWSAHGDAFYSQELGNELFGEDPRRLYWVLYDPNESYSYGFAGEDVTVIKAYAWQTAYDPTVGAILPPGSVPEGIPREPDGLEEAPPPKDSEPLTSPNVSLRFVSR